MVRGITGAGVEEMRAGVGEMREGMGEMIEGMGEMREKRKMWEKRERERERGLDR